MVRILHVLNVKNHQSEMEERPETMQKKHQLNHIILNLIFFSLHFIAMKLYTDNSDFVHHAPRPYNFY